MQQLPFFSSHNFHYTGILQSRGTIYISSTWEKRKKLREAEIDVKILIKIKERLFINLKFMLKLENSLHQVMSNTDKPGTFL